MAFSGITSSVVEAKSQVSESPKKERAVKYGVRTNGGYALAKVSLFTSALEGGYFLHPKLALSAEGNYASLIKFWGPGWTGQATHLALGVKILPLSMIIITVAPLALRSIDYRYNDSSLVPNQSKMDIKYTSLTYGAAAGIGTAWTIVKRLTLGVDGWVYQPLKGLSSSVHFSDNARPRSDAKEKTVRSIDQTPSLFIGRFNIGYNF